MSASTKLAYVFVEFIKAHPFPLCSSRPISKQIDVTSSWHTQDTVPYLVQPCMLVPISPMSCAVLVGFRFIAFYRSSLSKRLQLID